MQITAEILADPELMRAWTQESGRILADPEEDIAERIYVGCARAFIATLDTDTGIPDWGSVPDELPDRLVNTWKTAFDHHQDDQHRLQAAQDLCTALGMIAMAEDGDPLAMLDVELSDL